MYLGLIGVVLALGLASRRFGAVLPGFVAAYAGDTLWATLVFLGSAWLLPGWSTARLAALAAAFAAAIEISQLYQAAWINAIRHTVLGGLVLGFGFLWSDLVCYAVGIALGALMDSFALRRQGRLLEARQ